MIICHSEINGLWKKMEKLVPDEEYLDKKELTTYKSKLRKDISLIEEEFASCLEEMTNPCKEYYSKIFIALRQFPFKIHVSYFWPIFWDIHPKKSDKKEKKKWRIFKNALKVILSVKEKFRIDQDKFADCLEELSSSTIAYPLESDYDTESSDSY